MLTQTVTIYPAGEVDRQEFLRALNDAYSDYFVPIYLTPYAFEELVIRESVDLKASAAAMVGNRVVGMGLLAIRGKRGWIGGMGVVPSFRRRRIARQVMDYLIDQARQRRLATVQLEVITRNRHARHLYDTCGFQPVRQLLVLTYTPGRRSVRARNPGQDMLFRSEAIPDALGMLDTLAPARRPWQRERPALEVVSDRLQSLVARYADGSLGGVCLYSGEGSAKSLLDLAAVTPESGQALLAALIRQIAPTSLSYLNVADDDPMLPILLDAGFTETLRQDEMFLMLDRGPEP